MTTIIEGMVDGIKIYTIVVNEVFTDKGKAIKTKRILDELLNN